MSAMTLSCRTRRRVRPSALDSAAGQSIDAESRMASARSSTSCLLARTVHFLREPNERSMRSFARRLWCWFTQCLGELLVGVAHLHLRDDRFPLFRPQPLKRLLVALDRLTTDRLFER